jgi:hypothetical protein
MALTKSIIPVAIAEGLDTGTEPKLVSKGLLRLEDARISRKGAVSKRPGIDKIDDATFDGYMATYENKPVVYQKGLYLYNDTDGTWDSAGQLPELDIDVEKIQALGESVVLQQESAEREKTRAVIWVGSDTSGTLTYFINSYNTDTGLLVDTATIGGVATLSMVHVIATHTDILYFFVNNASKQIYRGVVTSTGASAGTINAATVPDPSIPTVKPTPVSYNFGACVVHQGTTDSWVMLAYVSDEGVHNNHAIVLSLDNAGTLDSYGSEAMGTGQLANCFEFDDTNAFGAMVYYDSAVQDIAMRVYASNCVANMNELVLRNWADANVYPLWMVGIQTGTDAASIYINTNDSNFSYPEWTAYLRKAEMTRSGAVPNLESEGEFIEGFTAICKPFDRADGYHYLAIHPYVATEDIPHHTNFVIRDDELIVGTFMETSAFSGTAPNVTKIGENHWRCTFTHYFADDTMGIALVDFNFDLPQQDRMARETRQHLTFDGMAPFQWDGQKSTEQGFHMYPHRIDTSNAAGASNLSDGTYGYCATYEWYDAKGNKHQSAPSLVDSLYVNATNTVTIKVPTLTITQKGSTDVQVILWRTDAYGSVYYRADSQYNPQYAASVTFTDTLADSSLIARDSIYTTGGILENVAPPPSRVSCTHQNRLFYVHRHNENIEIRYSKEFQAREGINHSDALTIYTPHEGGRITALRSFLDRLIIFKEDRIYSTYGTGLTDLGTGNGYADPTLLYPSLGCPNQKTIVGVPLGLIFQATDSRFYLLDRSFQVKPVGQGIEYWSKSQTISSSYEEPDNNEAVWLCETGFAMVYNWEYNIWGTWSNHNAHDCTVADSVVYWLEPSGNFVYKHASDYLDLRGGSPGTKIETGWFSFNQLEGFARIKRVLILGTMISAHNLRVKIAYDFDPYWEDSSIYEADTYLSSFGHSLYFDDLEDDAWSDQAYILEVSTSRQKCTSIRLHISDENAAGGSFELTAIAFEVAGKKGPIRLGSDRIKS